MDWLNTLIFAVLIAGHSALWVSYVNWTHALPMRCAPLHRLRRVHDMMIILGPILLISSIGFTGPQLLLGGSWSSLPWFWWGVVAVCLCGVAWLIYSSLWHLMSTCLASTAETTSQIVDLTKALGTTPVEPGKYQKLALLRLNEQFQVEFNHKTLHLPRLPKDLAGLTILHISDWHFFGTISKEFFVEVARIARSEPVDLVCFSGDLIDNMQLLDWIPETLQAFSARYGCYFILGNHDWYQQPEVIRAALTNIGWIDVASRTINVEIHGQTVQIGGDETPWMGTSPQFSAHADLRLLLSHTPDNIRNAQRANVDLMLSGHNHGGQVRLPLIGPVYSPSRYGTLYSSGTFWRPPTMLHISRGLAGLHPFRFRCHPEVTRLTLQPKSTDE